MSPLEIDFERYQRRIEELEAEVKSLDADNTTHLLAKEELADRVIELEAEVERLRGELHRPCISCGVLKDAPGIPDDIGISTPLDKLPKKESKFRAKLNPAAYRWGDHIWDPVQVMVLTNDEAVIRFAARKEASP